MKEKFTSYLQPFDVAVFRSFKSRSPWTGPWKRRQTTRTTRPCQSWLTCHPLRHPHLACPTWSAASPCAWWRPGEAIDQKKKKKTKKCHTWLSSHVACSPVPLSSFCVSCPGFPGYFKKNRFFLVVSGEVVRAMASNGVDTRWFLRSALNVRVVRIQTSAAVDRLWRHRRQHGWTCPQPACFLCGPRSPTRVQVFVANARIYAQRATDRDLESFFLRMLGYAHSGQPTVIPSEFQRERLDMCTPVNRPWSWECLRQVSTWMLGYVLVRHPTVILRRKKWMLECVPSAIFIKNCNVCNVCNVCNFDADLLFSIYYKSVTSVICYSPKVFDFISDLCL